MLERTPPFPIALCFAFLLAAAPARGAEPERVRAVFPALRVAATEYAQWLVPIQVVTSADLPKGRNSGRPLFPGWPTTVAAFSLNCVWTSCPRFPTYATSSVKRGSSSLPISAQQGRAHIRGARPRWRSASLPTVRNVINVDVGKDPLTPALAGLV